MRYSAEGKQYSSDVAVALLLILGGWWFLRSRQGWRWILLFGLRGAVMVWFSHPAVIVLASIGTARVIETVTPGGERPSLGRGPGGQQAGATWATLALIAFLWLAALI